jgi:hypothetical protein
MTAAARRHTSIEMNTSEDKEAQIIPPTPTIRDDPNDFKAVVVCLHHMLFYKKESLEVLKNIQEHYSTLYVSHSSHLDRWKKELGTDRIINKTEGIMDQIKHHLKSRGTPLINVLWCMPTDLKKISRHTVHYNSSEGFTRADFPLYVHRTCDWKG